MKKIAFLFPGQGSQYRGMGNRIFNQYSKAENIFENANDILGFDIKKIILAVQKNAPFILGITNWRQNNTKSAYNKIKEYEFYLHFNYRWCSIPFLYVEGLSRSC